MKPLRHILRLPAALLLATLLTSGLASACALAQCRMGGAAQASAHGCCCPKPASDAPAAKPDCCKLASAMPAQPPSDRPVPGFVIPGPVTASVTSLPAAPAALCRAPVVPRTLGGDPPKPILHRSLLI